jgi:hypothetical protein
MVRPQMAFLDPAFLLPSQASEHFAQVLPQLPIRRLSAAPRDEKHVVIAFPLRVT